MAQKVNRKITQNVGWNGAVNEEQKKKVNTDTLYL